MMWCLSLNPTVARPEQVEDFYLAAYFSSIDGTEIQIIPFDESDVIDMSQIADFVVSKGGTPIGSAF